MAERSGPPAGSFVIQKECKWLLGIRFCISRNERYGPEKFYHDQLYNLSGPIGDDRCKLRGQPHSIEEDQLDEWTFAGQPLTNRGLLLETDIDTAMKIPNRFENVFAHLRFTSALCRHLYIQRLCLFYDLGEISAADSIRGGDRKFRLVEVARYDSDTNKMHGTGDFTFVPFKFFVHSWTTHADVNAQRTAAAISKPKPIAIKPRDVPAVKAGYLKPAAVVAARAKIQGQETLLQRMARTHRIHKLHFRVSVKYQSF
jgi:hypothetical protein